MDYQLVYRWTNFGERSSFGRTLKAPDLEGKKLCHASLHIYTPREEISKNRIFTDSTVTGEIKDLIFRGLECDPTYVKIERYSSGDRGYITTVLVMSADRRLCSDRDYMKEYMGKVKKIFSLGDQPDLIERVLQLVISHFQQLSAMSTEEFKEHRAIASVYREKSERRQAEKTVDMIVESDERGWRNLINAEQLRAYGPDGLGI